MKNENIEEKTEFSVDKNHSTNSELLASLLYKKINEVTHTESWQEEDPYSERPYYRRKNYYVKDDDDLCVEEMKKVIESFIPNKKEMSVIELIHLIETFAQEHCNKAIDSIHRNSALYTADAKEITPQMVDSILADFVNYVAGQYGVNYGTPAYDIAWPEALKEWKRIEALANTDLVKYEEEKEKWQKTMLEKTERKHPLNKRVRKNKCCKVPVDLFLWLVDNLDSVPIVCVDKNCIKKKKQIVKILGEEGLQDCDQLKPITDALKKNCGNKTDHHVGE